MNMHVPPTWRQQRFLQRQSIAVPPTKEEASHLIDFILRGNDTVFNGQKVGYRIRYIREMQARWVGGEVVEKGFHLPARVTRLRMRSPQEIAAINKRHSNRRCEQPFVLVLSASGHPLEKTISRLWLLNAGNQKQLF